MSVYITQVFEMDETQIIHFITFSTFFAIIGSLLCGIISDRIGSTHSFRLVLIIWMLCFSGGALACYTPLYFIIGAASGLALGATWVVLRALAVRLIPCEKAGEMFGLFNVIAYLASIAGALFWGAALTALSALGDMKYRIAMFTLNIFIMMSLYFISRVSLQNEK